MPRLLRLTFAALALGLGACAQAQTSAAAAVALEKARQAKTVPEVLAALGVPTPEAGKRVLLEVPDIVVAGRGFTVKVSSRMPGTDWIAILSERDALPLVKVEESSPGADRSLSAEVKLAQTGRVRAIVRSGGKYYQVSREVKVAMPAGGAR